MTNETIQLLLAPAVVIPATGLLILSTSARQTAVLGRLRAMHKERLDAYLAAEDPASERARRVSAMRLDGIEEQTHRMLARARLLRAEILMLFVCILFMILSSLALGLSQLELDTEGLAILLFVLGLVSMFGAISTSAFEIARSLHAVTFEHKRVEDICRSHDAE